MNSVKLLLITLFVVSNLHAADFMSEQMKDFNSYKKEQLEGFDAYKKAQEKAYNSYKKEIGAIWKNPKLSSKKSLVTYTEDKKTRTDIDFSKEYITIQTVATSLKEASVNLKMALARAAVIDTKSLQQTDPLQKRLSKIKTPSGMVNSSVDAKPILSTVLFTGKITKKVVRNYVNKNISNKNISVSKSSKVRHAKIYSVRVKLPKNTTIKRSKIFYKDVKKNAIKQKLPVPLIFAIMHSESSFNPCARSHIPAYGLMQIVPSSAGIDAYNLLYHKKKTVSGSYLYNSKNNIAMGSGYLHILYYKYLKKIKDPDSRLYCTIAAYNTGAGNVAYAFIKSYNINKASKIINKLTPSQVYNKLMSSLKHNEPKKYLKVVSKRMSAYNKIYGM